MTLSEALQNLIPKPIKEFSKLDARNQASPYFFNRWGHDQDGEILTYWFWSRDHTKKRHKRLAISEMRGALAAAVRSNSNELSRALWQEMCPKSARDGGCGFAVMVRCLESLGIAEYQGRGRLRITDRERAKKLLEGL